MPIGMKRRDMRVRLVRVRLAITSAAVVFASVSPAAAQSAPGSLREFLVRDARLVPAQLDALERGEVLVKTLPTADQRNVAVMGLVRVDRGRGAVINDVRAAGPAASRAGRRTVHPFATPATLGDVNAMQLTPEEHDELAQCQPNRCNLKMPAADMAKLRSIVESKSPDAAERVDEYVRRRVVQYVTAYREHGNAAMIVYDDLGSVQSSSSFDAMLRDSSHIFRVAPALARFLLEFPRASLPGVSNAIFWAVDTLPRVRPVLRIIHEMTYTPAEVPGTAVVAAKQLYANHYFEAGLEVLTAVDDSLAGFKTAARGTVVVAVRHYRFDNLPSGGVLNLRGRVIDGMRNAVVNDLKRLRGDNTR